MKEKSRCLKVELGTSYDLGSPEVILSVFVHFPIKKSYLFEKLYFIDYAVTVVCIFSHFAPPPPSIPTP